MMHELFCILDAPTSRYLLYSMESYAQIDIESLHAFLLGLEIYDINSVIRFNFNDGYQLGQAGVAVMNVEAEKEGNIATGIIKIEQETNSKETIFL